MAPTEYAALIVAHGAPSSPSGVERVMQGLAASVATLISGLPRDGWAVRGATLAMPGALGAAVQALPKGVRLSVYPHFMSDGWFTSVELPRRLREAGVEDYLVLPAFGLDPGLHRLCLRRAEEAVARYGPGSTALLLAAHGSPSDPRPGAAAEAAARFLAASGKFREVRVGFVDQAPYLAEAARVDGPALCLPFFATRAGHVEADLPQALGAAGFPGPVLEPIGVDREVPAIVAAALTSLSTA